jgi:hypothetical protein
MTSACSTPLRQRVCPSTRLPDRNRRRGDTGPRSAIRGTQYAAAPDIGQPRVSPDAPVQRGPLRPQEPVTSQATTAPGSGSRNQTSADGPIASISTDPTRHDRIGRTHSPSHGDALRPNAAYPAVHNVLSRITAGQRALLSTCVTLRLVPAGAAPPWLVS